MSDLKKTCKDNGTSIYELSENRIFKSRSYLQSALQSQAVAASIMMSLADYMGVSLKEYEIPELPALKALKNAETQSEPVQPETDDKWKCEIRVDEDYGTVMARILKDGKKLCTGRSYLYGTDDAGILQSISYATHMCYKLIQQNQLEEIQEMAPKAGTKQTKNPSNPVPDGNADANDPFKAAEVVKFKDWVRKYEKDNSVYGAFARYVVSHYQKFPSNGEKQMKTYLVSNQGSSHITVFKTLFKQYLSWCKLN